MTSLAYEAAGWNFEKLAYLDEWMGWGKQQLNQKMKNGRRILSACAPLHQYFKRPPPPSYRARAII